MLFALAVDFAPAVSAKLSELRRSRTYLGHVFVSTRYLMLAWAASNTEASKAAGTSPWYSRHTAERGVRRTFSTGSVVGVPGARGVLAPSRMQTSESRDGGAAGDDPANGVATEAASRADAALWAVLRAARSKTPCSLRRSCQAMLMGNSASRGLINSVYMRNARANCCRAMSGLQSKRLRMNGGGSAAFHSATAVRKAMFSPEKSRRAENWRSGSGSLCRTCSRAAMVSTLSSAMLPRSS